MRHHIHTAFIAALVAALITLFLPRPAGVPVSAPTAKESTFDRIMRTGEIRCGYFNYAPAFMTDANSGTHSGILHDIFQELGKSLQLKIVWAQEINLGTFLEDLNRGRYDLECAGGWPNALRGRKIDYTSALFYAPIYAYGRKDDYRFDTAYASINNPSVRIATIDGEYTATLQNRRFSQSTNIGLPQGSHLSELTQNVLTDKADLLITDRASFLDYDRKNPGQLRQVAGPPVSITTFTIALPGGETRLQNMLNTALDELRHDGVIDSILDKYETEPGTYLRIAPPYLIPAGE